MKLEGKSVFSGIAIGKCKIFGKKDQVVKRSKVTDTDLEIKRFTQAKCKAYEGRKSGGRDHTCAGSKRESS